MTFQGISEEENYNVIEYKTETKYGYDYETVIRVIYSVKEYIEKLKIHYQNQ